MKKKLFTAISLGILSAFVSGVLTASAAELVVNGGPNNITPEQKAEWVDEINGGYTAEGDANNNTVYISSEVEITSNLIAGGYTENGKANGNKVSFDGVKFTGEKYKIHGGYSKLGNVSGNVIEISNSHRDKNKDNKMMWIAGGETEDGNVVNNQITITDSSLYGGGNTDQRNALFGGYSHKGDAISNNIKAVNSHLSGYLAGGRAFAGNALGNYVVVDGGSLVAATVYGADVDTGNGRVEYNVVRIKNAYVDVSEIVGGNGNSDSYNQPVGELNQNAVEIENSSFNGMVSGAMGIGSSKIVGNIVSILSSNNASKSDAGEDYNANVEIYGGYSKSDSLVQGNIVQIFDSTIILNENSTGIDDNRFYGGYGSGDVKENLLAVNNSNVEGLLVGGSSRNGNVANNIVAISGEGVKGNIYGGLIKNGVGNATHNKVFIDNSIVRLEPNEELPLLAGGVTKNGAADNNYVAIVNSKVGYGGSATRAKYSGVMVGGAGSSSGSENTFVVSGSEVNLEIVGGYSDGAGKADGNEIIISDSKVNGIYGGLSTGAGSSSANNKVILNNSESNSIYGGFAEGAGSVANNNLIVINSSTVKSEIVGGVVLNGEKANDNTVVISGASDVSQATIVGGSGAESQNNTLTLDGWSGSAESVAGFDNYSFQNIKNINDAVLTVKSASDIDADTKFDVSFAGSVDLQEGQSVKLISVNNDINVKDENINTSVGTSLDVAGSIVGGDKSVDFKVGKITLNRQTDLIVSANAAAAAFLADGGELAVDGLAQINSDEYGFNTFAATHGANSDYDNGTDLKGLNNIVGVGHNAKTEAGDFAWGVFYEGGTGEYDTVNAYKGTSFNVDGKAVYNGYGAAARLSKDNGMYYEAGVRAGKLKNDLSNALMDANNIAYGYKTESDYFGYHVGVGKEVALNGGDKLDVYARYYHTKVDGDSFVVGSGDRYSLDKVYSDRIRVGGRYTDNLNEAVKVYYGAAYEYEFSGEAEGAVKGYAMEKSDLGGSSFVGELGLLMNNPGSAWTVDMALQAYGGQREGFGGEVQATYHF